MTSTTTRSSPGGRRANISGSRCPSTYSYKLYVGGICSLHSLLTHIIRGRSSGTVVRQRLIFNDCVACQRHRRYWKSEFRFPPAARFFSFSSSVRRQDWGVLTSPHTRHKGQSRYRGEKIERTKTMPTDGPAAIRYIRHTKLPDITFTDDLVLQSCTTTVAEASFRTFSLEPSSDLLLGCGLMCGVQFSRNLDA